VPDVIGFQYLRSAENADNRLYGSLGNLLPTRRHDPACRLLSAAALLRRTRTILTRRPWVDVVFGTHNIGSLPALLERRGSSARLKSRTKRLSRPFPSNLPNRRESGERGKGFDQLRLANNTCTLLHRPALRWGRETDRRPR
jgi:tRNA-2-methylthio-N6-dimethylallyladenosine synthase